MDNNIKELREILKSQIVYEYTNWQKMEERKNLPSSLEYFIANDENELKCYGLENIKNENLVDFIGLFQIYFDDIFSIINEKSKLRKDSQLANIFIKIDKDGNIAEILIKFLFENEFIVKVNNYKLKIYQAI